jgi:RNA polymerase sigma-70 factor (ECF subfamily)
MTPEGPWLKNASRDAEPAAGQQLLILPIACEEFRSKHVKNIRLYGEQRANLRPRRKPTSGVDSDSVNRNRRGGVLLSNVHGAIRTVADAVTADTNVDVRHEFEERLAESGTLAMRVAFAVLRNREDAEDVAQEALVRAYQRFRSLRDPARFRSWVIRIAWRLALDHKRAAQRRERREQAAVGNGMTRDVEQVAVEHEFRSRLLAALDDLPPKLRLVMTLSAIQGYDTRELAALLRVAEGTVKSRLHTARRMLVERLR